MNFDFKSPSNIIFQPGCSSKVETFEKLKLKGPILIVTDTTLVRLGIAQKVFEAVEQTGVQVVLFDQVDPEPKVSIVRKALQFVEGKPIATVIGLGGGSPMDISKIISLLIRTPQGIESMFGVNNCEGERLPLILVPTTAGTGSEVTHVAVVTGDNGEKSPIVDPKLICDTVILDAKLTLGLPPAITAATGIDAMVHSMEAFTSGFRKNVVSDQLALHAFTLLYRNISDAVHNGGDLDARCNMLIGSMLAGLAFANATVGAVHALSYPLGAHFNIAHGESNALVMVPVMRFNNEEAFSMYAEICRCVHPEKSNISDEKASDHLLDQIANLIPSLGLHTDLAPYGIGTESLDLLTEGTLKQARLLSYNFRKMEREDIYRIFEELV